MASTYTLNNGIELIGTGEQSGTWGDTTNTNLSLVDTALDGQVTVTLASAGTSGSPNTLPISDGAASDGRNRMVIFNDGGDLGATAYVQLTPNDAEKIIYVRNDLAGSRSIILFQGTYNASNDYELPAGTTAVIYFDGAGSGAVAANVFNNAYFDSLRLGSVSVTEIIDDDTMATASATNIATSESIKAYVDTQVGANNELSEVLANGNTTGGTDISVSSGDDITFADSSKAIFGAGSDLQIYHDGTHSYVTDEGTGALYLRGAGYVYIQKPDGTQSGRFDTDGAVDLFHNGVEKFSTTSTGIDVTGTVTADGLTVDGDANLSGTAINFDLDETDTTDLNTRFRQSAGQLFLQTITDSKAVGTNRLNVNHTTGDITFYDTSGNASFVYDESAGSTFNEQGDSKDFRVESDNQSHMFFLDASANSIGIRNSSPSSSYIIDAVGDTRFDGNMRLRTSDQLQFADTNDLNIYSDGTTNALLRLNNGRNLRIDATGAAGISQLLNPSTGVNVYYGNNQEAMRLNTEAVFNETSLNRDFRVESNNNSNMLFVDAGLDNVGIGTGLPTAPLEINASTVGTFGYTGFKLKYGTSSVQSITMGQVTAGNGGWFGTAQYRSAGNWRTEGTAAGVMSFSGGGAITFSVNDGLTANTDYLLTNRFHINPTDAVFNEPGNDYDFRVESDSNANMIFVDANLDAVGIGTGTIRSGALTVGDTASGTMAVLRTDLGGGNSSGTTGIYLGDAASGVITLSREKTSINTSDTVLAGEYGFNVRDERMRLSRSYTTILVGGGQQAAKFSTAANTFNEEGRNIDFRVEGDSVSEALVVDAGQDNVGVGSYPNTTAHLDVDGSVTGGYGGMVRLNNRGSSGCSGFIGVTDSNWSIGSGKLIIGRGNQGDNTSSALTEMVISGSEVVFNENSNNRDFRVESDGKTHMLFVDANTNTVKFGRETISGASGQTGVSIDTNGRIISNVDNDWNFEVYGAQTGRFRIFSSAGGGTQVGSITASTSSTSYNTSSDYRLKENVVELTGATARLKQLEPKRFNFIADADTTVDGFLAHEVQSVVPEAITGTHNEVDADGNPVYQGIDQSKLVPLLVATIKELEARITALENA